MGELEIIARGRFEPTPPLADGECSIARNGTLTCRDETLRAGGIETAAVLMVDRALSRLALRAPREEERDKAVSVGVVTRRIKRSGEDVDTRRRRIDVRRALRCLSLTPADVAGRYELVAKGGGNETVYFITLAGTEVDRRRGAKAKR